MALFSTTRLDGWFVATLSTPELILVRLSVLLSSLVLFVLCHLSPMAGPAAQCQKCLSTCMLTETVYYAQPSRSKILLIHILFVGSTSPCMV
jgi:hypothetical protein